MSQGGKVWQNRQKLGVVVVTGMQLRKKFAVFSLLLATPVLLYLLRKHDASWLMSVLIILSLIPAFFTSLSGALLEIAPKLHQDIKPLQKIQVLSNLGRLSLLGLILFIYPFAAIAIASTGVSQIWSNWRLRKISTRYADSIQIADPEVHKEILKMVKRIMPGAFYYCISGQITIWVLSIFGSTDSLAQVGALSRLSMLLNLINLMLSMLVVPRFSRLYENRKILNIYYTKIITGIFLICIGLVLLASLFSKDILWVLGNDYSGLDIPIKLAFNSGLTKMIPNISFNYYISPLILMILGSCIGLIAGIAFTLNSSRGVLISPLFAIPYSILAQIIFLSIFDLSEVIGVLAISFLVNISQALMYIIYFTFRTSR
jgi:hypothetical protein